MNTRCKYCGNELIEPEIKSGKHWKKRVYCNNSCYFSYKRSHPESSPAWKGGRVYDFFGYILIRSPNHPNASKSGYVREHRLLMEQHLGRLLNTNEAVHHINGIRDDNRLDNLVVCKSNGRHYFDNHFKGRNEKGQFI